MAIAVLLMVVACTLIPLGDVAAKTMIQAYGVDPIFVAWSRFVAGALLLAPVLAVNAGKGLGNWRGYFRGVIHTATIVTILTALATEDIGTVYGAFFLGPPVSYLLSVLLLGERVTPLRTVLLLLGFAGVLLVVKPGFGMTTGLAFALVSGMFYGMFLAASRWVAGEITPLTMVFMSLVTGSILLAPSGIAAAPPDWPWGWLALSGLASLGGNFALIRAYALAPATKLAPFVYFQLIAATSFGVLFFATLPDTLALLGLAVLIGSGFASLAIRRGA